MKNYYTQLKRWLTWATLEEACASEGQLPLYKKICRKLLP